MLAAVAVGTDAVDPLSQLVVREHPDPAVRDGWVRVRVLASSVNQHDLWTLKGVGIDPQALPLVLGCDASGVDEDGREVIVHPVLADPDAGAGDETLDPNRKLLSEAHDGTFAEYVSVPARNVLPKPSCLTHEQAAAVPVAYTTAYRMLFTQAKMRPGQHVLIQGAGGGVATAAIVLARSAGAYVTVATRSEAKRSAALRAGAHIGVEFGQRLTERVDVVIDTVGQASWAHSIRALRPGGALVTAGATTGSAPSADLSHVFYRQIRILGSTGGTRADFQDLLRFMECSSVRPVLDSVHPFRDIRQAFARLQALDLFGKVVLTHV